MRPLQSVGIMHSLIPIAENNWASISLGRLDQYLYPFYKKSMESGETKENVVDYLKKPVRAARQLWRWGLRLEYRRNGFGRQRPDERTLRNHHRRGKSR